MSLNNIYDLLWVLILPLSKMGYILIISTLIPKTFLVSTYSNNTVFAYEHNQQQSTDDCESSSVSTDKENIYQTKDRIKENKCFICEHKYILACLNNFIKQDSVKFGGLNCQNQSFTGTSKAISSHLKKMNLKQDYKKILKRILKEIYIHQNTHKQLIVVIIIYFFELSNHLKTLFLDDFRVKTEIICMFNRIYSNFVHSLRKPKKNYLFLVRIRRPFRNLFKCKKNKLSIFEKSDSYIFYEVKLDDLLKEYEMEYIESISASRSNRIISLFFTKTTPIFNMIYTLDFLLKYGNPEILFIFSFFYFELNNYKTYAYGENCKLDVTFNICVDNKLTLDILKQETMDFNRLYSTNKKEQYKSYEKMEKLLDFLIEKYSKITAITPDGIVMLINE